MATLKTNQNVTHSQQLPDITLSRVSGLVFGVAQRSHWMFVSWNNNGWIPFGSIGTLRCAALQSGRSTTPLPIERPTLMFTGIRYSVQTARRCCWLLCLLLGGILGGVVPAQDSADTRVAVPSAERQKSIRAQLDETLGLTKATNTLKKS